MHIMVLGLRGFPGIQGGIETHAEHLYPLLAELGCDVEVLTRSPYMPPDKCDTWRNVRLTRLWSPDMAVKGVEAFVHSLIGTLYAALKRPDLLHIHGVGPALMTPLARLLGLRVVVTHHGPDYDREKWGRLARWILRSGERMGMCFSSQRIVISEVIRGMVREKYERRSALIPNGVNIPRLPETVSALHRFGLEPGRYIVQVSRLVPEKRQTDLIQGFAKANLPGWKLVLVGSLTPADEYIRTVMSLTEETPDVVLTDFQKGTALQELYAHAGIFVLPSSHEGLPIALLEALSYGLPAIASDIPANLEVGLPEAHYFPLGNISAISQRLEQFADSESDAQQRSRLRSWVMRRYNWKQIAEKTLSVYAKAACQE